jgi:hypothetical protein
MRTASCGLPSTALQLCIIPSGRADDPVVQCPAAPTLRSPRAPLRSTVIITRNVHATNPEWNSKTNISRKTKYSSNENVWLCVIH